MKIVLCHAPKKISIEDARIPEIKSNEVLVKIKYCGICAYDLKRYLGLNKIYANEYHLIGSKGYDREDSKGRSVSGQIGKILTSNKSKIQ